MERVQNPGGPLVVVLIAVAVALILIVLWLLWLLSQRRAPGQQPPAAERPHVHFAPGQLSLFVRHRAGLAPEQVVERLRGSGLFPGGRENDPRQPADPRAPRLLPERVVTFDASRFDPGAPIENGAFSLVFADVPAQRDERDLLLYLGELNRRIAELPRDGDFRIGQAGPSWLSCGSPRADGSGGPGGKPVPPRALGGASAAGLPAALGVASAPADRGAGVDVFILDTAPCDVDLRRAYDRWVERPRALGLPPQALLEALIGPGGALGSIGGGLRIDYAGHAHLLELAEAFLPDHDYVMADHGLFIAGIVNALAPAARLHLIEVLNPYGVGTLETIVRGFARVADYAAEKREAKVVINASLFLAVGQKDEASLKALAELDPFWANFKPGDIDGLVAPLREVCDFLHAYVGQVVAAAGNDGRKRPDPKTGLMEDFHPAARFPAAYERVVGVAALNHDGTAAGYTNRADLQPAEGIATFGGDKAGDDSDRENSPLSVYIGAFPSGEPNTLGLARWSGTSFATPRVVAAFAALMGEGVSAADALAQIKAIPVAGEPLAGGDVLPL